MVCDGPPFANLVERSKRLGKRDPPGFDYGVDVVRGVNIGGWLVLEPWITPSIFQAQNGSIVDEWTLGYYLGQDEAYNILKPHWDTWCTLADFQKIAASGFNLVRIPIGYWAYQKFDDPFTQGAAPYMDLAIDWARQTGLKVWIDLHGAPGSQNGFDNSGHWTSDVQWQQGDTIAQTLSVLHEINQKYAQPDYQDVVVGIELVNEPLSSKLNVSQLYDYYQQGFSDVRSVSDTTVVLHDGFLWTSSWDNFLTPTSNDYNVLVDHHEYQVFNLEQIAWQPWQHRQGVCNGAASYSDADHWVVVGEWTAAMTDCAPALNGYQIGARYDGTYPGSTYVGSCDIFNFIDLWNQTLKDDTRGYIEAQMETFERYTQGWIFWNFKTEASAEWDAFRLIDAGVFPQPLTDRKFSAICS
ncbi:glycoside hydrolase family 5 protein [Xylona heveae TC161]|uniref:glucan 1,3-beta-glucosidase n=1 Tax=Xylona heveae (strain CBS 132557 / TC161) TaxID=1328760 RepID=A0A165I3D5_XYLHT|nr:glycoside hydrolase family 5 protein [Xylona heveae TC161]KZF24319.1 glycoside hydrolase family 5 protein [Xylona heveae TC161]